MKNNKGQLNGLGRLVQKDARDHQYLMPRIPEAVNVTYKYWQTQPPLDQGDTPQCVAYAGFRWLTAFPVKNIPKFAPADLYYAAQTNDEWPGEDYDGTSVHGLFKALKNLSYVDQYLWAFDLAPVIDHLLTKGPVVVGTTWTDGMFMVDREGFIDDIGGQEVGGHAYVIVGVNKTYRSSHGVGAFRMLNSWGPNWGDHGRAWISFNCMSWLLKQDGEACTAHELLIK